uniref:Gametogenetin-binding protein 2 n=1 Tax=Sphaeramia orbicularis TaxID=375764 RepID=A0A673AUS4_9TELE
MDIAQEEVLTCLGIHLYERLHRIWQKLRAEEQTWQILFHLGVDALRKSFEVKSQMQGISRLEQFLKQEKKRQKKKNRRKNKCGYDVSEQEAQEKDQDQDQVKACGGHDEEEPSCEERIAASETSSCRCPDDTKPDLSPHSNGSDCGYSSSMEGSETGSGEGSDIACSEGICNHDDAGGSAHPHHCADDKEDGTDSCVDCWTHSEPNTQCKSKKKKRKGKGLCTDQVRVQTTGLTSARGDDSEAMSDEENCLTQDEIQAFIDRNQSFYDNRHRYRQHLKEKFTDYCRWFATASVN